MHLDLLGQDLVPSLVQSRGGPHDIVPPRHAVELKVVRDHQGHRLDGGVGVAGRRDLDADAAEVLPLGQDAAHDVRLGGPAEGHKVDALLVVLAHDDVDRGRGGALVLGRGGRVDRDRVLLAGLEPSQPVLTPRLRAGRLDGGAGAVGGHDGGVLVLPAVKALDGAEDRKGHPLGPQLHRRVGPLLHADALAGGGELVLLEHGAEEVGAGLEARERVGPVGARPVVLTEARILPRQGQQHARHGLARLIHARHGELPHLDAAEAALPVANKGVSALLRAKLVLHPSLKRPELEGAVCLGRDGPHLPAVGRCRDDDAGHGGRDHAREGRPPYCLELGGHLAAPLGAAGPHLCAGGVEEEPAAGGLWGHDRGPPEGDPVRELVHGAAVLGLALSGLDRGGGGGGGE
mmetsp:Transcript_8036/g.18707  ORF Transcript_8036/g.18707 Transcript_8036/m.18707 type:complete len:404 (-) Transcript_8036:1938-3149(-)